MHLLTDARALESEIDGIGRYSIGVLKALRGIRPDWNISVIAGAGGRTHLEGLHVNVIENNTPRFRPGENRKLSPLIASVKPDCYLNFSMAGPCPNVPTVLSVHDLMVLTVPGYFGRSMIRNVLARMVFRRRIARSVKHAAVIATLSRASMDELESVFPGSGRKAFVSGAGQDLFSDLPKPLDTADRDDYILYIGNARAYKNVTRLVVAYSRLRAIEKSFPGLRMVVRKDRAYRDFMTEVEDSHANDHIHVSSHVSDSEIRDLYMRSLFLAMPSIKEGFGLPALEAMAAGTPVLASYGTALEELVGDAGILVDPFSIKEIMTGMARMWSDPELRKILSSRAQKRAGDFTWERTAGIIAEEIEGLV